MRWTYYQTSFCSFCGNILLPAGSAVDTVEKFGDIPLMRDAMNGHSHVAEV